MLHTKIANGLKFFFGKDFAYGIVSEVYKRGVKTAIGV